MFNFSYEVLDLYTLFMQFDPLFGYGKGSVRVRVQDVVILK